jgi:hypothetical protein
VVGEDVTRVRRVEAGVDRYGNPTYTDDPTLVEGAFFDPGSSGETVLVGGVAMVTSPTLYFPQAWPDLVAGDAVIVRGTRYEVDGRPADWKSPWGTALGGLVVKLTLAEGGGV